MNGYDENTDTHAPGKMLFPQTKIMTDQSKAENAEISLQIYGREIRKVMF